MKGGRDPGDRKGGGREAGREGAPHPIQGPGYRSVML